jgi:hypothetical protein
MTNQQPPELFPQRPISSDFAGSKPPYRKRRLISILVLVAVIGAGVYLRLAHTSSTPEEIPTIEAEGPMKEKPEQPGGIPIPHQDVMAYQQLDNSAADNKPEADHMLPPPETPQAAAPTPAPADQAQANAPKVETLQLPPPPQLATTVTDSKPSIPPAPPAAAPSVTAPTVMASTESYSSSSVAPAPTAAPMAAVQNATPSPAPAPAAQTAQSVETVAPPASAPAAAVTPAAKAPAKTASVTTKKKSTAATKESAAAGKGGYRIQLASIPDEASAQEAARHLQTKYASVLGKNHLHLVKADLGSRGIYYRVQSSPLGGDSQAHSMCDALKSAGAGCIVVHP